MSLTVTVHHFNDLDAASRRHHDGAASTRGRCDSGVEQPEEIGCQAGRASTEAEDEDVFNGHRPLATDSSFSTTVPPPGHGAGVG